jgi:hypothetical protein
MAIFYKLFVFYMEIDSDKKSAKIKGDLSSKALAL